MPFPATLCDKLATLMVGNGRDALVFTDQQGVVLRYSQLAGQGVSASRREVPGCRYDNPGNRFSGEELAEMLRLANLKSVAALLSWPARLSNKIDREWPWRWHYPTGDTVVYWMTPKQADVFRAARTNSAGPRKAVDAMIVVGNDNETIVNPQITAAAAQVVQIAVDEVPLEALKTEAYEVECIAAVEVTRTEAALVDRFHQYLAAKNHRVRRYRITPDGSSRFIYPDLADTTSKVLYEAKGSVDRMAIRLALGQVLDYGRYVRRLVADVKLAVLLPEHPPEDMRALLEEHDVGCVVELGSGTFADLTPLARCP